MKIAFYTLVIGIFFAGQFLMNHGLKTGKPPFISQPTLAGQDTMNMLSRGPGIIYFWASWCGICKMMQQPISQILADYPVVTIAVKSGDKPAVQNYLTKKRLNWNVVNDPLGSIAANYKTRGVPSIFFLNKQGEIALTTTGYTSEMGLRFRLWLVSLFDA